MNRHSYAVPNATGTHGGRGGVEPVGDRPGHHRRNGPPLGVRAGGVQRHHAVADRRSIDAGADLADGPGAQVADDVRARRRRRRRGRAGRRPRC